VLGNEPILELIREKPLNMPELRESKILTARQIAIFGQPLLDRLRRPQILGNRFPGLPTESKTEDGRVRHRRFKALKAWKDARGII